jgi:hypothetical protein
VGAATRFTDFWAENAAAALFDRLLNSAMLATGIAQGHGMLPSLSPYQLPAVNLGLDTFRALLARSAFARFVKRAATRFDAAR